MNKIILTFIFIVGLTLGVEATDSHNTHLSENHIAKLDRYMTRSKAQKRKFRTKNEFRDIHNSHRFKKLAYFENNRYENGNNYSRVNNHRRYREYGYSYPKRGWILAYKYDRASFYDDNGFFYGYFNRYGYYFEDEFYRYDRYYTYRDRVRGRGLFNHKYFIPADANYYGFTKSIAHRTNPYYRDYGYRY